VLGLNKKRNGSINLTKMAHVLIVDRKDVGDLELKAIEGPNSNFDISKGSGIFEDAKKRTYAGIKKVAKRIRADVAVIESVEDTTRINILFGEVGDYRASGKLYRYNSSRYEESN